MSRRASMNRPRCGASRLSVDDLDDLVDARRMLVLHELRELRNPFALLGVRLAAPAAIVVLAHIEHTEGHDLIIIADVAHVIRALETGGHGLTRIPCTAIGL